MQQLPSLSYTGYRNKTGTRLAGCSAGSKKFGLLVLVLLALSACANGPSAVPLHRFEFGIDTFAYSNELEWEYAFNAAHVWEGHRRTPSPDYTLHCFVVARDARQFYYHARFLPDRPKVDTRTYFKLVRLILERNAYTPTPADSRIVIPGYASLHEFSRHWETLLKLSGGGAWQSFLQRGNWRMVFPFSRDHQQDTAYRLQQALSKGEPPIVHVVTFPERTIDHAVLIYDAKPTATHIEFDVYDPNDAQKPITLRFDRSTRTFEYPRTRYFAGGNVDIYEVYKNLIY